MPFLQGDFFLRVISLRGLCSETKGSENEEVSNYSSEPSCLESEHWLGVKIQDSKGGYLSLSKPPLFIYQMTTFLFRNVVLRLNDRR